MCGGKACPNPLSVRHHYSVVVKTFALDAEVTLAARVPAPPVRGRNWSDTYNHQNW